MKGIDVAGRAAAASENFEALARAARESAPGETRANGMRVFVWQPEGITGVNVMRIENNATLAATYTDRHTIGVIYDGALDWWYRRETTTLRGGALKLKEPGEVHRDRRIHAPFTMQEATFSREAIEEASAALGHSAVVSFQRVAPGTCARATRLAFAMHDALAGTASVLEVQVRVAETLAEVLATCTEKRLAPEAPRAIVRVREYLHDAFTDKIGLDELAVHVGLNKYCLVRAFRAEFGIPPYEYLTQIRVARARELLALGCSAAQVAQAVGLYDESQLHRHFRRIVGISPGRYARALSAKG
ncbi:helix-turn-helix transcriptional regulator [Pendulispora albinea]|uniref:AraC family transcriptional regulator n=1 Tax=Pendulispora albinea TaxID=2741071 RepID=A0ABZ2M1X1_9BACT